MRKYRSPELAFLLLEKGANGVVNCLIFASGDTDMGDDIFNDQIGTEGEV